MNEHDLPTAAEIVAEIVERVGRYWQRLRVPGDAGERAMRNWLISELLIDRFGWSSPQVLAGEVFDILLLNRTTLTPRIYIETKSPLRQVMSPNDEQETRDRCSRYGMGTLEAAYLTNGHVWRHYAVRNVAGSVELRLIQQATLADGEAALGQLLGGLRTR